MRYSYKHRERALNTFFICVLLLIATNVAAWGTHVWSCLTSEQWGFLIAGAVAFPVAIVHGIGIWFGAW
jgi:hypothetical protein